MGIVQTVLNDSTCGACLRVLFEDGVVLVVEAAISPHKTVEIVHQLADLRDSSDGRKQKRYYDLEDRFEQLAAYGELEQPREMRQLQGELWELKTGEDRVPFYWVGATTLHRKAVRLTHQFAKATGKTPWGTTPARHLDRGQWILKGDQDHG